MFNHTSTMKELVLKVGGPSRTWGYIGPRDSLGFNGSLLGIDLFPKSGFWLVEDVVGNGNLLFKWGALYIPIMKATALIVGTNSLKALETTLLQQSSSNI